MVGWRLNTNKWTPLRPLDDGPEIGGSVVGSPGKSFERFLICAVCDCPLAKIADGMRVQGRHLHTFMNPAGVVFHVRVFREAAGVSTQGTPSHDYSWFEPLAWQIAICRQCRAHVGWVFGGERSFVGLIAERVVESDVRS